MRGVNTAPDGKVTAIHIKTGGFLGFGGKMVAIPEGKFTQKGDNIQLGLTADEVSKLPEVKEQASCSHQCLNYAKRAASRGPFSFCHTARATAHRQPRNRQGL